METKQEVVKDLTKILRFDVTYDPNWIEQIGSKNAYYVRGFTWFRTNVIHGWMPISKCPNEERIGEMEKRIASREEWQQLPFAWADHFGARQFIDAGSPARKNPPRFDKAVKIMILCEVIADEIHAKDATRPQGDKVYDRMQIEAAVSYLPGFDAEWLGQKPLLTDPQIVARLKEWTGQRHINVFKELAAGNTVTHRTAQLLYGFLKKEFNDPSIGEPDFHLIPGIRFKPAPSEFIDYSNKDLPEEAKATVSQ